MGRYQINRTTRIFPPVIFGVFGLVFVYTFHESGRNLWAALSLMSVFVSVMMIVAPKVNVVTDEKGISLYRGKKLDTCLEWGEIESVETISSEESAYLTILRNSNRSLRVGTQYENGVDLVKVIRARATKAKFDDLTKSIASSGYPERSPLPLIAVLVIVVLVFGVIMAIIR